MSDMTTNPSNTPSNTPTGREIKFRAWDGSEMWTGFHLLPGDFVAPKGWFNSKIREFTWMQYTGLKDKNGTEIYEGDLVRITHEDYDPQTSAVEYVDGAFHVKGDFYTNDDYDVYAVGYLGSYDYKLEVVGNIYQDPELLQ